MCYFAFMSSWRIAQYLIALASIAFGLVALRYYLVSSSSQILSDFRQQNYVELDKGNTFDLARRLNSLSKSVAWNCIQATRNGEKFYEIRNGDCQPGYLRYTGVIESRSADHIEIRVTFGLPVAVQAAGAVFALLQIILLVLASHSARTVERIRISGEQRLADISAKVAHDIRAPVAALNVLLGSSSKLDSDEKVLMESAIQRIQAISSEVLAECRGVLGERFSGEELQQAIRRLLNEKSAQHQTKSGIAFALESSLNANLSTLIRYRGELSELQRAISNLIDNSVEAIPGEGKVLITIDGNENSLRVAVTDNGKGISIRRIERVAHRGYSFGKSNGTGLGLYQARQMVESWGGKFSLASREGSGTTVTLILGS